MYPEARFFDFNFQIEEMTARHHLFSPPTQKSYLLPSISCDNLNLVNWIIVNNATDCMYQGLFFFKWSNNRHTKQKKKQAIVQQTLGITDNVAVHHNAELMGLRDN